MEAFFALHDPTRPRLGRRSRYRSAIFGHSAEQARAALDSLRELATVTEQPVLTEVVSAPLFWRAEERHRRYFGG